MQAVLRDVLEKFLPDDVHIRSSGRVRGENSSILVQKFLGKVPFVPFPFSLVIQVSLP